MALAEGYVRFALVENEHRIRQAIRGINKAFENFMQKKYQFHSNYPGGLKERSLSWMLQNKPEEVIRLAVKRMLP